MKSLSSRPSIIYALVVIGIILLINFSLEGGFTNSVIHFIIYSISLAVGFSSLMILFEEIMDNIPMKYAIILSDLISILLIGGMFAFIFFN